MSDSNKTWLIWLVLFGLFSSVYLLTSKSKVKKKISFSQLITNIKKGNVTSLLIQGQRYEGKDHLGNKIVALGPPTSKKLRVLLFKHKVKFSYKPIPRRSFLGSLLVAWLPMLLIFLLIFYFMKKRSAGMGKNNTPGNFSVQEVDPSKNPVTFKDVAGIEEAQDELDEIVQFLENPTKFTRLGGRLPRGVLLIGPPGVGKTLLARAVAGEAGVPFFALSGSDFVEMFVGVGANRVRELFEKARQASPSIVFIDEIDAVGRKRGVGQGGGNDEREQTLNQLLVEMNGFSSSDSVIVIGATNRADILDPALLRPGRFDRRVMIPFPDIKGREKILRVHTRKTPLSSDVDLALIARATPGLSGAELQNLVNEAALIAARGQVDSISLEHFEKAQEKVMMGKPRNSMILSKKEKRKTAIHEAGHALVGKHLSHLDPVHKVTIIPRGQALGLTMTLPQEDRKDISKQYLQDLITFAMGGRAADEFISKEQTAGASDDIRRATAWAKKMVCEWGMSDKIGPIMLSEGDEGSSQSYFSEKIAEKIDQEVKQIVSTAYQRAVAILEKHHLALKEMIEALIERETLNAHEIDLLAKGKKLSPFEVNTDSKEKDRRENISKDSHSNDEPYPPFAIFEPKTS